MTGVVHRWHAMALRPHVQARIGHLVVHVHAVAVGRGRHYKHLPQDQLALITFQCSSCATYAALHFPQSSYDKRVQR